MDASLDRASFFYFLAWVAMARGDNDSAHNHSLEGLRNARLAGHDCKTAVAVAQQAQLAKLRGDVAMAGRLFGLASTHSQAIRLVMLPYELIEFESVLATAREHLADAAFSAAWADGEKLSLNAVADDIATGAGSGS